MLLECDKIKEKYKSACEESHLDYKLHPCTTRPLLDSGAKKRHAAAAFNKQKKTEIKSTVSTKELLRKLWKLERSSTMAKRCHKYRTVFKERCVPSKRRDAAHDHEIDLAKSYERSCSDDLKKVVRRLYVVHGNKRL
jgi:hypothetical protein